MNTFSNQSPENTIIVIHTIYLIELAMHAILYVRVFSLTWIWLHISQQNLLETQ